MSVDSDETPEVKGFSDALDNVARIPGAAVASQQGYIINAALNVL